MCQRYWFSHYFPKIEMNVTNNSISRLTYRASKVTTIPVGGTLHESMGHLLDMIIDVELLWRTDWPENVVNKLIVVKSILRLWCIFQLQLCQP